MLWCATWSRTVRISYINVKRNYPTNDVHESFHGRAFTVSWLHIQWFYLPSISVCGDILSRQKYVSRLHFQFCFMRFSIPRTYLLNQITEEKKQVPSNAYDSWADQTTITQALLVCFILFHFHAFTNSHSKVGSFIIVVFSLLLVIFVFYIVL